MMIDKRYELAVSQVELEVDFLLDEVEIGKGLWNHHMTNDEYRAYIFGQWAALQNIFKSSECFISECDYNRILAKLDKLYDHVHNKMKEFDPFFL
jgi:hypothetical protein